MTGSVLLGTDNGFVVKHTSPSTDVVVFAGTPSLPLGRAHDYEDEILYGIFAAPNNPQHVNGFGNTGDARLPFYSSDRGDTWTAYTYPNSSMTPAGYPFLDTIGVDGVVGGPIDEDGVQYAAAFKTADLHGHLFKGNSYTNTAWVDVADLTALGLSVGAMPTSGVWIGGGYLWWITGGTSRTLNRLNTAGTNWQTWDTGTDTGVGGGGLQGLPGTNLLIAWSVFGGSGSFSKVLSIDITDPDNPTFSASAVAPFGGDVFYIPVSLMPISDTEVIATTWNDHSGTSDDTLGGIWRSTDAGITWTAIKGPSDPHLGNALLPAFVGFDNEAQSIAVDAADHNHVWAVGGCPYIFESTDGGLTWDEQSVDLTIFDGYSGGGTDGPRPHEWCSIAALAGAAPVARRRAWAQLVS